MAVMQKMANFDKKNWPSKSLFVHFSFLFYVLEIASNENLIKVVDFGHFLTPLVTKLWNMRKNASRGLVGNFQLLATCCEQE